MSDQDESCSRYICPTLLLTDKLFLPAGYTSSAPSLALITMFLNAFENFRNIEAAEVYNVLDNGGIKDNGNVDAIGQQELRDKTEVSSVGALGEIRLRRHPRHNISSLALP